MEEVIWTTVFAGVAVLGALIAARSRSHAWRVAGTAYVLGGLALALYVVLVLPHPPVGDVAQVIAGWSALVGFIGILAATIGTLIAIGRAGRRKFLLLFAAATFAVATYGYWTTNWPARYGDANSYCFDHGHGGGTSIERLPPGVHCLEGDDDVFVPADGISWLALAGWSVFYGFLAAFPLMGIAWLRQNGPRIMPART